MNEEVRAKEVNTNEWCYGNLVETDNGYFIVESATSADGKTLVIQSAKPVVIGSLGHYANTIFIEEGKDDITSVCKSGRFTKVYADDLIKTSYTRKNFDTGENEEVDLVGILLWSDDFDQWEVLTDDGNIHRMCTFIEMYGVNDILGNPHDNSEIFKTYFPKGV